MGDYGIPQLFKQPVATILPFLDIATQDAAYKLGSSTHRQNK